MPSKTKKQPRSQSKLSDSKPSLSTPSQNSELTQDDLSRSLRQASTSYPSFIGNSALPARLTQVISQDSGHFRIWLSEDSMVPSNLSPGAIVSVSLASREKTSGDFPLVSLARECARCFRLDFQADTDVEVGNYFALATVCARKIMRNEVCLSSNLSCTMGCPPMGSILFIYPVQIQYPSSKQHGAMLNCLSGYNAKNLFLQLVPTLGDTTSKSCMLSPIKCVSKATLDQFENGFTSSPKTPAVCQSKMSSPNSRSTCDGLASSTPDPISTLSYSAEISEILADERTRKLLQLTANSWLCSRTLLCGNFISIPVLLNNCIFRVAGGDKMAEVVANKDTTNNRGSEVSSETCSSIDWAHDAFTVNYETEVSFSLTQPLACEAPRRRVPLNIQCQSSDVKAHSRHDFAKLGGLSKEYVVLKDIISSSANETLSSLGLRTTKGVLLHGPPGTGKTSMAHLCARDAGVKLFSINGPEIISQYYGESEKALQEVFDSASQAAPAVVFIDELDAIAPARKEGGEELSQRMVATLLNLMDGISRTDGIVVIAATNRPDSLEPALRRPGRLDREIEIGVPSPTQRLDILRVCLSEMGHCLLDQQIQHLATSTHGFVGADLAALCNEAALICLRRHVKFKEAHVDVQPERTSILVDDSDTKVSGFNCSRDVDCNCSNFLSSCILESSSTVKGASLASANNIQDVGKDVGQIPQIKEIDTLEVSFEDFEGAKRKVRPSAMREVIVEVPKVRWEDVGGQKEIKTQLIEAVEWPQKHKDAFDRIGTGPPTGVLMFGPPGCSKTLLARAVASEAGLNFLAVKGPELFSKWVGESEKAVRSLFAKARANAPSIVFFDEIDGLAVIRGKESDGISVADRVMSQLLVELDGLHQRFGVTVVAATNRPDKIDPALLRPGRFDRLLYVGPPNETDREEIFHIHLRKMPCTSDVSVKALACLTEGCTGADISLICREAAVAAIEETLDASAITMEHLKTAIRQVQPSELQSFHGLSVKFQRLVHSDAARVESQPCPRRSNWISFWGQIKSFTQHLYLFGGGLTYMNSGLSK